jgi:membrane-associated phospholipid phosphatase
MIAFIENHPQLFSLGTVIVFIMILLWLIQHFTIRYGKNVLMYLLRYAERLWQYLCRQSLLIRFRAKHPAFFGFLEKRFRRQYFHGLTLTLSMFVVGYILALFAGLVEDVVTADSIVTTDLFVSQHMSVLHETNIVPAFIFITSLGSTPITCLIVLLTAIICAVVRQPYLLIGLLLSTIGSTTFTFLSKVVFQRARPIDILLSEQTYSFPSGHATISIALYGFIAYLVVRFGNHFAHQVRFLSLAIFLCLLIGLSRILLNEHYLSDVMGGFLVGALWLTIAISVMEWLTTRGKIDWHIAWSAPQRYMMLLSIGVVLIATCIYAIFYQFPLLG